jgi:hypothetical protein
MYNQDYDSMNGRGSAMMPFLMGIGVGIAAAAFYVAARNNRFGEGIGEKIESLERGLGSAKEFVVDKASAAKDMVANKFGGNNDSGNDMGEMSSGQSANRRNRGSEQAQAS